MSLARFQREWVGFTEVIRLSQITVLQFIGDSYPVALLRTPISEQTDAIRDLTDDVIGEVTDTVYLTVVISPEAFDQIRPVSEESSDNLDGATASAVAALLEAYMGLPWGSIEVGFVSAETEPKSLEPPCEPS